MILNMFINDACHCEEPEGRRSNLLKNNTRGFSLLEMTVVIIVATILATALIPQLIKGYSINAANKTALDISAIQEASRAYYVTNNNWPSNIAALQAANFLPSSWNAINPFGYSSTTPSNYNYNISSNGALLTVSTAVPVASQPIIQNLLPVTSASGNIIYSSVPVPGALPVLPSGTILPWPTSTAPAGFLPCDGSIYNTSSYPGLAAVLGSTYGGNGTTTFAVPDLRGRTIVGLNQIPTNDGSDRIWWTDSYFNNQGQAASYNVNQIGGIFGEEKHRQTLVEMPPHTHNFSTSWYYSQGHQYITQNGTDIGNGGSTTTNPTGGNGDGSGLGAPANVVQPSMAMGYIIKY